MERDSERDEEVKYSSWALLHLATGHGGAENKAGLRTDSLSCQKLLSLPCKISIRGMFLNQTDQNTALLSPSNSN